MLNTYIYMTDKHHKEPDRLPGGPENPDPPTDATLLLNGWPYKISRIRYCIYVVLSDLKKKVVVPVQSFPMCACAPALDDQLSHLLNGTPDLQKTPSVTLIAVRVLAGGAAATRRGVKSSNLGLRWHLVTVPSPVRSVHLSPVPLDS